MGKIKKWLCKESGEEVDMLLTFLMLPLGFMVIGVLGKFGPGVCLALAGGLLLLIIIGVIVLDEDTSEVVV